MPRRAVPSPVILTFAVLLALAALAVRPGHAQRPASRVTLGVHLGYARSALTGANAREANVRNINGTVFGGLTTVRMTPWLSLQGEVLLTRKGGGLVPEEPGDLGDFRLEIAYLEFPLGARVFLRGPTHRVRPVLFGAVAPAFRIGCELEALVRVTCEDLGAGEALQWFDLGVVGGAGVEVRVADSWLRLSMRLNEGLTNMIVQGPGSGTLRNRQVALMVGMSL